MKTIVASACVLSLLAGPVAAQEMPQTDATLVVPPDLRPGAKPSRPAEQRDLKPSTRRTARQPAAQTGAATDETSRAKSTPAPMQFGVAVHGAGTEGQHYSVSGGTAPPGEESGNGMSAGFRFGF